MPKSMTNYREFMHRMRREHLPRSDRFEVEIGGCKKLGFQNFKVTLMCEEAQIPGLSGTNIPYKIGPWTEYRTQNVEFLSTDLVFTFLVDENWSLRTYFEAWINHTANMRTKEVSFYSDITADVRVKSLDVRDNVIAEWRFIEAMPKLLNITPVAWNNTQQLRMSLSMSAKRWETVYASYEEESIRLAKLGNSLANASVDPNGNFFENLVKIQQATEGEGAAQRDINSLEVGDRLTPAELLRAAGGGG